LGTATRVDARWPPALLTELGDSPGDIDFLFFTFERPRN